MSVASFIAYFKKHTCVGFLSILSVAVFGITSYRLYYRVGVFGCGDECINYTAGYFLQLGKALYTQIFFNRQPSMAYASWVIQTLTHPTSLYQLVVYHRLAIIGYTGIMGGLLIVRFGSIGALFLLLYEGTKYYLYGYQFIGEAIIVYPLVYMLALLWESFSLKPLKRLDWYAMAIWGALIFWTREPYIPVMAGIMGVFIWKHKNVSYLKQTIALFLLLLLVPFFWIPRAEYIRQVIMINTTAAGAAIHVSNLLYAWFYPVMIFVDGKQSYLRLIEIGMATFLLIGAGLMIQSKKNIRSLLTLWMILGLAAIRAEKPGIMYFEAFHMLPWFGLAAMSSVLCISHVRQKTIRHILIGSFVLFALWAFAAPRAFIWEKADTQAEFTSQYAKYTHYSTAIKILTDPSEKIFLDMWDDIIYWESQRDSSYPYSLYIPVAAGVSPYKEARRHMFVTTPPDIYYSCPALQTVFNALPADVVADYVQLNSQGIPSCLYLKKTKVATLSKDQYEQLKQYEFTFP